MFSDLSMTNLVLAALFAAGLIHVTRGAPQANGEYF